jgi:hypothetical protein
MNRVGALKLQIGSSSRANDRIPTSPESQGDWLEPQRGRADAWYLTWPILYEFLRLVERSGGSDD